MKRFLSAVLALILLLSTGSGAKASNAIYTDEEQYRLALIMLNGYLKGEKQESLDQISVRFSALKTGEATGFFFYVSALSALEKNDLSLADIYLSAIDLNAAFKTLLDDPAFQREYPNIRGIKTVNDYINGRSALNKGDYQIAMQYFAAAAGFLNSTDLYNLALNEYLSRQMAAVPTPTPPPTATPAAPVTPFAISAYNLNDMGQNLLQHSEVERSSNNGFLNLPVREALSGHEGETITISFDLRCDTTTTLWVYAYQDSGISIADSSANMQQISVRAGNIYQRFAITTTVRDYGRQVQNGTRLSEGAIAFFDPRSDAKASFSIRLVKIELGSRATDWTPHALEMTATPVPQAVVDESIVKPMTSVPGHINPNLFQDGEGERVSSNGFMSIPCRETLQAHVGKMITISFDLKVSRDSTLWVYAYQNSGISIAVDGKTPKKISISASSGYVRFAFTTTVRDYGMQTGSDGNLLSSGVIAVYDPSTSEKAEFTIRRIKVEEGSYATNWSLEATATPVAVITPIASVPDNLAVVGQNLMVGSEAERKSNNGFLSIPTNEMLEGLVGQTITISFELQTDRECTLSIYAYQDSGLSIAQRQNDPLMIQASAGASFQRFSVTTTVFDFGRQVSKDGTMLSTGAVAFYDSETGTKANFRIRRIKIELGNRATQWTLSVAELPTATPAPTPIPVLTPMVKTPAAATSQNVNLLDDSEKERKSSNGFVMIPLREALEAHIGQQITITFEISVSQNRDLRVYAYQESGVSIADTQIISVTAGSYQRFCIVTRAKDYGRAAYNLNEGAMGIYDTSPGDKVSFTIRKVKVEVGTTPTQWTPSAKEQITPKPSTPKPPTATPLPTLTLTVTTNREVNYLSWNAISNVSSYTIKKKRVGNAYATLATLTATSYQDMSVVGYISYTYQVEAKLKNGVTIKSNEVTILTSSAKLETDPFRLQAAAQAPPSRLSPEGTVPWIARGDCPALLPEARAACLPPPRTGHPFSAAL